MGEELRGFAGALVIDYRGTRHVLGRTADAYGIWSREAPGDPPFRSFPLTNEGWARAWNAYQELESRVAAYPIHAWMKGAPIPLRPMRATQVFAGAWKLYWMHLGRLLVVAAVVALPVGAVVVALTAATLHPVVDPALPELRTFEAAPWAEFLGLAAGFLVTYPITTAAVGRATAFLMLGESPTVDRAYHGVGRALLTLVLTGLPSLVAFAPGSLLVGSAGAERLPLAVALFLLVFLPAFLFVYVRFLFGPLVAVTEGAKGVGALGRAWRLSEGVGWRMAGALALLSLVVLAVFFVFGLIIGAVAVSQDGVGRGFYVASAVFGGAVGLVFGPLLGVGAFLLYADARVRKEGLDETGLASELGGPAR